MYDDTGANWLSTSRVALFPKPIFARNSREGLADGEAADIPADQFVSVRVEMPQNSIWNQRAAMAQVPDSSPD